MYVERPERSVRFRWVKAPTRAELTALTERIARRVGRFLERQGVLERDEQKSYLAGEAVGAQPSYSVTPSAIASPWGRTRAARCSPCRP